MDVLSGPMSPAHEPPAAAPPPASQSGFLSDDLQNYPAAIQDVVAAPHQQQQPQIQKRTLDVFVNFGLLLAVG